MFNNKPVKVYRRKLSFLINNYFKTPSHQQYKEKTFLPSHLFFQPSTSLKWEVHKVQILYMYLVSTTGSKLLLEWKLSSWLANPLNQATRPCHFSHSSHPYKSKKWKGEKRGMVEKHLPKPLSKYIKLKNQNQSNHRANHKGKLTFIFSQSRTNGIHGVIYLFSQTKYRSKIKTNHISYFESEMAWHKPIAHLVYYCSQLGLPVKHQYCACFWQLG